MRVEPGARAILRIELWHVVLLGALLAMLGPRGIIDAKALLLGGLFMGANFLLLGIGVRWVLTPLASGGRMKVGVALLSLKFVAFLGLLAFFFLRLRFDGVSFALGFSTLLVAILAETLRVPQGVLE